MKLRLLVYRGTVRQFEGKECLGTVYVLPRGMHHLLSYYRRVDICNVCVSADTFSRFMGHPCVRPTTDKPRQDLGSAAVAVSSSNYSAAVCVYTILLSFGKHVKGVVSCTLL